MSSFALIPRGFHRSTPGVRRTDPFDLLNRFFDGDVAGWLGPNPARATYPRLEIKETEDHLEVIAEVPGLTEKDLEVSLSPEADTLVLSGTKHAENEEKQELYYRSERSFGNFRREIALPCPVEPSGTEATLTDGLLRIKLAKNEAATKEHKIAVKATH